MRQDVADRMSASSRDFATLVWPLIRTKLGGGTIDVVESVTASGTAKKLDVLAGIDVWQYLDGGMRGIASRVQWCGDRPHREWPFRTFTVRKSRPSGSPTEWQKRLEAVTQPASGLLYPHLTVQAYVRRRGQGPVDAVGVVKTGDLVWHLVIVGARTRTAPSGEVFYHVTWDELRSVKGVDVFEASSARKVA